MQIFLVLSFVIFFRSNNAQTNSPTYENKLLPDFDAENVHIANPEGESQWSGIPEWADEDVRRFLNENFKEEAVEAEPSKFSRKSGDEAFALLIAKQSQENLDRLTREADTETDLLSSLKTSITKAQRTYPWLPSNMINNELKLCLARSAHSGGENTFEFYDQKLANVSSYSVKCITASHKERQARYIIISIFTYAATYTPNYDLIWVQPNGSRLEGQIEHEGTRRGKRATKDYDHLFGTLIPCVRDLEACRQRANGKYPTNFDLLQAVFEECLNRAGFTREECNRKLPMSTEQTNRLYLVTVLVPCATNLRKCHRERQRYYSTKFNLLKDLMTKCMDINDFDECSDQFQLKENIKTKLRTSLPTTTTASLVQVKRYNQMTSEEKNLIKAATRRRAVAYVRQNYRHFF